jgi:hypothetical protein
VVVRVTTCLPDLLESFRVSHVAYRVSHVLKLVSHVLNCVCVLACVEKG